MFAYFSFRVPPVLWPRLHDDLSSYIVQREANGILVFYWYHRQFIAVARKRYLHDSGHNKYIHSLLADYFLGKTFLAFHSFSKKSEKLLSYDFTCKYAKKHFFSNYVDL